MRVWTSGLDLYGKISESELCSFENANGVYFPRDYRDFLLANNGGVPKPSHRYFFEKNSDRPASDVQLFYGVSLVECQVFTLQDAIEVFARRFVDGFISIAADSLGNQFLLAFDGSKRNSVYFWDHEREALPPDFSNMSLLSDSFQQFVRSLRDWTEKAEPEWLTALRMGDDKKLVNRLAGGLSAHVVFDGRSIIEYAAIYARDRIIARLFDRGAKLGNSLHLAQLNLEFFSDHESTVALIHELVRKDAV